MLGVLDGHAYAVVSFAIDVYKRQQIDDVVVSLDVLREKFLCNLEACKGECCIEGDAGADVYKRQVFLCFLLVSLILQDFFEGLLLGRLFAFLCAGCCLLYTSRCV